MLTPSDDDQARQVKGVCDVLNAHDVQYVVFGSFAGRLQGVPLRTLDVDVVPEASSANLQRLCDALNTLQPRWRVDDISEGLKIDGRWLEPRHILGSSIAIGLVTSAGLVDVVLEPKGFELGYTDLVGSAVTVDVAGTSIRVGALADSAVTSPPPPGYTLPVPPLPPAPMRRIPRGHSSVHDARSASSHRSSHLGGP